ncbi:MAG TPA: anti-sigma factor [Anaerolineales bacterium]|nr:anti-sigma factor [Anaerolineales bacterium]
MESREIEELLPFYALDALTDEERELVEAYLRAHPEARQQLDEMKEAVSALPQSVSPVEPAPRTKEALMARVAVEREAKSHAVKQEQAPRPRETRWVNIFQAFGLGAATVAILWAIVLNVQLSYLRTQVSTLSEALVAQSNALEQINQQLAQQPVSETVTISLKGTDVQPQAQGQLIADPNKNSAVLVIAGLDQLEPGKTYQVWLIDGGSPKSAGLLSVDSKGQAVLIVTSELTIGEFNALGISVEPEGGSQQPTGDIVVLSDL